MPTQNPNWLPKAALIVAVVTAFRVLTLAFSHADLFVDESQYWLWGQNMDFGYYSKPPLIAWVIRATTELAGSNAAFWVRLPAPIFHGATALILALWASREFDSRSAPWVAAAYVTLPIVALGSVVISTDTIMAPFFALALLFYFQTMRTGKTRDAVLTGAMIGVAFMAKYAGIYFILTAAIAMIFLPGFRLSLRNVAALLLAFTVVITPNILWNLAHDLTTLDHTLDNVDWVRDDTTRLNPAGLAEFFTSQFIVMGPIFFTTLLILPFRSKIPKIRGLLILSLPIIALVCVQALLSRAYGNWAFAAYFAATLATIPWLLTHHRRWLVAGLAINVALSLAMPMMTVFADKLLVKGEPIMIRYLGRDELSHQILDLAAENSPIVIVANNRDVLADLFITGADQNIKIFATAPKGRAKNYYQQTYPFSADVAEKVLYISRSAPDCGTKIATFNTTHTAYKKANYQAFLLEPDCFSVLE